MSILQSFPGFSLVNKKSLNQNSTNTIVSEFYISDEVAQAHDECSSDIFQNISVKLVQIYQKPLQEKLPWYKNVVATIAKIPKCHAFIYIQAEDGVFMTIDFYAKSRIAQRIGKAKSQVLYSHHSDKRLGSKLTNNKMFSFASCIGDLGLTIQDVRKIKQQALIGKQYSQFSNNCCHYCERFMAVLKKRCIE